MTQWPMRGRITGALLTLWVILSGCLVVLTGELILPLVVAGAVITYGVCVVFIGWAVGLLD